MKWGKGWKKKTTPKSFIIRLTRCYVCSLYFSHIEFLLTTHTKSLPKMSHASSYHKTLHMHSFYLGYSSFFYSPNSLLLSLQVSTQEPSPWEAFLKDVFKSNSIFTLICSHSTIYPSFTYQSCNFTFVWLIAVTSIRP